MARQQTSIVPVPQSSPSSGFATKSQCMQDRGVRAAANVSLPNTWPPTFRPGNCPTKVQRSQRTNPSKQEAGSVAQASLDESATVHLRLESGGSCSSPSPACRGGGARERVVSYLCLLLHSGMFCHCRLLGYTSWLTVSKIKGFPSVHPWTAAAHSLQRWAIAMTTRLFLGAWLKKLYHSQ